MFADLPLLLKSREAVSAETPCLNIGSVVACNKLANNLNPIVSRTKMIDSLIVAYNFVLMGFDGSIMTIVPFLLQVLILFVHIGLSFPGRLKGHI